MKLSRRFALFVVMMTFAVSASAQGRHHRRHTQYTPPPDNYYNSPSYSAKSPWDFSGLLGLYNPGFGIEGLAAYRVVDRLLQNTVDNSLSVEAGLGWISASNSVNGVNFSYSEVEIPIMARWDFHLTDTNFIVGPRAGFNFLSAGTATINGVTYTDRGGSLYFQMGGFGMYQFTDHWAARLQIMFINYTAISGGVTYFL